MVEGMAGGSCRVLVGTKSTRARAASLSRVSVSQNDPVTRLRHARRRLNELVAIAAEFFDSSPYDVQVRRQNGEFEFYLARADPIPEQLSLVAGDAIHAMRAALDNLVWQLALTVVNDPYDRISWPMANVKADDNRLRGVPAGAAEIIRVHAPDASQSWALLGTLDRLWNDDKHRNLTILATYAAFPTGLIMHPSGTYEGTVAAAISRTSQAGIAHQGDTLLRLPDVVDGELEWRMGIVLGNSIAYGEPALELLEDMWTMLAHEVLPSFRTFLPGMEVELAVDHSPT